MSEEKEEKDSTLDDVKKEMIDAAMGSVSKEQWDSLVNYALMELGKLRDTLANLSRMYVNGEIDRERLELHVRLQTQSMQAVLLSAKGVGIIEGEKLINAAIGVAKRALNSSLSIDIFKD